MTSDIDSAFDPLAQLRVLNEHGIRYVVIGGFAATAYGSPLPTADVDVTPEPTLANLARLSDALRALDARVRVEAVPGGLRFDHDAASLRDVTILNLVTTFGDLDIVMQPQLGVTFADLAARAVVVSVHDVRIPLAALDDVIALKQAAGRPKDRLALPVLRALRERLSAGE